MEAFWILHTIRNNRTRSTNQNTINLLLSLVQENNTVVDFQNLGPEKL
jgi:hypothetical protein